jgi:hypothetical protein
VQDGQTARARAAVELVYSRLRPQSQGVSVCSLAAHIRLACCESLVEDEAFVHCVFLAADINGKGHTASSPRRQLEIGVSKARDVFHDNIAVLTVFLC